MNLKSILLVSALAAAASSQAAVVINKIYGGGGNSGAILSTDYVELFNNGTADFSLNGYSLQYASATNTTTFGSIGVFSTTATVPAMGYYLIQLAGGTSGGVAATATPDAVFSNINLSATSGKLILNQGTTGASVGATGDSAGRFYDLVGYGSANQYETAVGPTTTTNSQYIGRNIDGLDTNNNALDFGVGTVTTSTFHNSQPVPEPSAFAALGLGAVAILRRRRSTK